VEAAALADLVRRGVESRERCRELIAIAPAEEEELRKLLPAGNVSEVINFRMQVLNIFDSMLADAGGNGPGRRKRRQFIVRQFQAVSTP
jgi:hypothetical protein